MSPTAPDPFLSPLFIEGVSVRDSQVTARGLGIPDAYNHRAERTARSRLGFAEALPNFQYSSRPFFLAGRTAQR